MKKIFYILSLLLLYGGSSAFAQIGFKTSLFSPRADLGPTFKKSVSYEIYAVFNSYENKLQSKVGYFHVNMAPRLDTFPEYGVEGDKKVLPGYAVYERFKMNAIFMDHNLRLFHIKDFSMYAGFGVIIGISKMRYTRHIETLITETDAKVDNIFGGLRTNITAGYDISKHVQVYAEYLHGSVAVKDWSAFYSHNMLGIGVNYQFYAKEDE